MILCLLVHLWTQAPWKLELMVAFSQFGLGGGKSRTLGILFLSSLSSDEHHP